MDQPFDTALKAMGFRTGVFLLLSLAVARPISAVELVEETLEKEPVSVLAPLLLGELGNKMIGVDRSNFPYDIRFFSRPIAWYGLCQSDWITLRLEQAGGVGATDGKRTVHVWSFVASPRFKITPFAYQPLDAARERQAEASCFSSTDMTDFFPAANRTDAYDATYLFDYVRGAATFKDSKYSLACTGSCNGIDVAAYLRSLEPRHITQVSRIDCEPMTGDTSCMKFSLTGSPPGLFPRELRVFGQNHRAKTTVRDVRLWIGVTMF